MVEGLYPRDLIERLREAIETVIKDASKWDSPVWEWIARCSTAHLKILDRHDHRGVHCLGDAPEPITGACPDLLALASIYFPESETPDG